MPGPGDQYRTQRRRGLDLILHLVNYHAEKRQSGFPSIEWLPRLDPVPVRLRCAAAPKRVRSIPEQGELAWEFADGVLRFAVRDLVTHAGALIEF